MNKLVNKFINKLQTKYRKLAKKARDLGLSLPIALLIFLTFFSIITVAVIQTRRDTTLTRASGACSGEAKCPSGIGTYMEQAGCEQICGAGNCSACCLSTTKKYWCSNAAPTAAGGGYDLPTCKGASYNLQSACEKELGGTCTKCTNDGASVRWHKGTGSETLPSDCQKMNCQQLALPGTKLNKTIYADKATLKKYYPNTSNNCSGASMSESSLVEFCTNSIQTANCQQTNCLQLSFSTEKNQYRINQPIFYSKTNQNSYYANSSTNCNGPAMSQEEIETHCLNRPPPNIMPQTNGHCEPGIIGTNSDGTNKYAEKVPCNLSCSSKCPSGQAWATASNSTSGPCCYKTAIDGCVTVTGMCQNSPVLFTYPQTTVLQQTITSPVITAEGETIYCNQLTCIVL